MSYLGSTPASQFFAPGTDTFSGTGSQTAFTLSRNVATVNDILVVVNNVDQQPSHYTVLNNVLTFSPAPSAGTNNIYVRYLSTNLTAITPNPKTVGIAELSATGTPSATTFLRGDNTWAAAGVLDGDRGDITVSSSGAVWTIDSGVVTDAKLSLVANASNIKTAINASGSAPIYACRAWVNFNGSGAVAIRASGNVSSITDNGVGNYTANFSTAMPDVNYAATAINDLTSNGAWYVNPYIYAYNTGSVQYLNASSYTPNLNPADCVLISITVFR